MDADGNLNVYVLVALVLAGVYLSRRLSRIQHYLLLKGDLYYREIMNTENASRLWQVARMEKDTFNLLKANLWKEGCLPEDSLSAG